MKSLFILFTLSTIFTMGCAKQVVQNPVFWPPHTDQPRIQFLMALTNEEQLNPKSKLETFLTGPELQFKKLVFPVDVASSPGKIYVTDRWYKKVAIINLETKQFNLLNDKQTQESAFVNPGGLFVTRDDEKYVTDLDRKVVVRFDSNNDFVRLYGSEETLKKPVDVAVYENKVYVCDFTQHQVIVFDKDSGEKIGTIGEPGAIDSESGLYKPRSIQIDRNGNIYISCAFNFSVRKFNNAGEFIQTYGSPGDALNQFARPKSIAIDNDENLYALDAAFNHAKIFNKEGQLLLVFGGYGWEGQGQLILPVGIEIDYENVSYFSDSIFPNFEPKYLVYVTSMQGKEKLSVYLHGEWKGEEHPVPAPVKEEKSPEKE